MLLNKRIPFKYITNKVKLELTYVLILSLLVLIITNQYRDLLPDMPLTIPVFLGTAISILLSFKLNQSYDRWWEARKIWGAVVNDSRSLVVQLQSFVQSGNESIIQQISLQQIAWCYSLGQSLRGLNAVENLEKYLRPDELDEIRQHSNKPLAIIQLHSRKIKQLREEGKLDLFAQVQIDETLVRLVANQGMAERIKSTVFPVTYRIFLHAIIYLFVITLSIALRDVPAYFEIPLLLLISAAFFLLEKTATHMQDPFENRPTDTAMTTIARTIEINIKQLNSMEEIPSAYPNEKFYSL